MVSFCIRIYLCLQDLGPTEFDPLIDITILDQVCCTFCQSRSLSTKPWSALIRFRSSRRDLLVGYTERRDGGRGAYSSNVISPQSRRQYTNTGRFIFGFDTACQPCSISQRASSTRQAKGETLLHKERVREGGSGTREREKGGHTHTQSITVSIIHLAQPVR